MGSYEVKTHYVIKGLEVPEDYAHKPFDWDGFDVDYDLTGETDYNGIKDYFEDHYRVDYVATR